VKSVGIALVRASTRRNKPIHGFVCTKDNKTIILEIVEGPKDITLSERHGMREVSSARFQTFKMAYVFLLEASEKRRAEGWVLTAMRSL
jgi:hypothetical protein